jgi:hypothetical protein
MHRKNSALVLGIGMTLLALASCSSPMSEGSSTQSGANGAETTATSMTQDQSNTAGTGVRPTEPDADWIRVSTLIGAANEGDTFIARSPQELEAQSDWVFTAAVHEAGPSRSFATRASPEDIKYETFGFQLRDVQRVGGTSEDPLPDELVVEVIAPMGSQLEEVVRLLGDIAPARVIVFGDDFSHPDSTTTVVYGTDERTMYVAPHAQGLAVESGSKLVSIADGLGGYLTKEYGLKSVDDAVQWLHSTSHTQ